MFNTKNTVLLIITILFAFILYKYFLMENYENEHKKHHEHMHHKESHHQHAIHNTLPQPPQNDELWAIGGINHTIWKTPIPCANGQCAWTQIPGALKNISVGEFDIWGTGPGTWAPIWKCDKPCTGAWKSVPGSLAQVFVGKDTVYGVNDDGNVFSCPHTKSSPCTGQWTKTDGYLGPGGVVSLPN